jgi:hypothetical protein
VNVGGERGTKFFGDQKHGGRAASFDKAARRDEPLVLRDERLTHMEAERGEAAATPSTAEAG